MKQFKNMFAVLLVALVALSAAPYAAQAASFGDVNQYGTTSTTVVVPTVTNYGSATAPAAFITLTRFTDVQIKLESVGNAGFTNGTVTLSLFKSDNGTTADPTAFATLAVSANATTTARALTNLTVNAIGYLGYSITNTAYGSASNTVTFGTKPARADKR